MSKFASSLVLVLSVLSAVAADEPWGQAYSAGVSVGALTGRTVTGGAILTDEDRALGFDEIRFASGEVKVAGLVVSNRTVAFVGNGTTLKPDSGQLPGDFGGAIFAAGGAVTVTNLVFDGFSVEAAGGAVTLQAMDGDCVIADCTFTDCSATASPQETGQGGAVYASAKAGTDATLFVRNSMFDGCSAASGGAISTVRLDLDGESPIGLSVESSAFTGNLAGYQGGALLIEGDVTVTNAVFAENFAWTGGGAICVGSDFAATEADVRILAGTVFSGNVAHDETDGYSGNGGAIALSSADIRLLVERTAFEGNRADYVGGAIADIGGNEISISTSVFSNNLVTATEAFGGAVSVEGGLCAMTNVTVRGSNGNALDFYETDAELVNCVVVDNGGADVSSTVFDGTPALTALRSAFGSLAADSAVAVTTNECLVGRTAADYADASLRLREGEPYNPLAVEGLVQTATDFDGVAYGSRPCGWSMGAFETPAVSGISGLSVTNLYDGAGHSNEFYSSSAAIPVSWRYATAKDGPYGLSVPAYTNSGKYTTWAIANLNGSLITNVQYVVITNRIIELESAGARRPYNGYPLTTNDVWVVGTGDNGLASGDFLDFACSGTQTNVGTNDNAFACSITNAFGAKVTDNYTVTEKRGKLIVEMAAKPPVDEPPYGEEFPPEAGPFDGPEHGPQVPPVPEKDPDGTVSKLSNYDWVGVYDGSNHTYEAEALTNAVEALKGEGYVFDTYEIKYSLTGAPEESWQSKPFSFRDVTETPTSFWYRVAIPNYTNYIHAVGVTITNRPATITSGTKTDFVYDGEPHAYTNLTVEGFVEGEGLATTSKWATVTNVGTNDNCFTYTLKDNTLEGNYTITVVTGKIAVVVGKFTFALNSDDGAYDGQKRKVDISPESTLPKGSTVWYSTDGGTTWTKDVAPTFKDVTNVTVTVKVTNPNYEDQVGSKELKITPRAITLSSKPGRDWDYDGEEHTLAATNISVSGSNYALGECLDYIDLAKITEKGSIPATFKAVDSTTAKASNYNITYEYGTLTINAAKHEVGVESLSIKIPYDGKPHGADWKQVNPANLIAGDEIDAKLDGITVTTPDDGIKSNTFAYARILRDGKTDVTANYSNFTIVTGTLQIVNADFQNVTAAPIVKTYDGQMTNIEVRVNEPLATEIVYEYSLTGEDGSWDVNPDFKDACEETTVWYKVSAKYFNDYVGKTTVEVKKRKVTFESQDRDKVWDGEKLYTDDQTITPTGLVEGEEAGVSYGELAWAQDLTTGDGVEASFKAVFDGTKAKESNYEVSYSFGRLRINPAGVLTVRADSHEFKYGDGDCTWHEIASKTGLLKGHGIREVKFDEASHIAKPSEGPVDNVITDVVITNADGIVDHSVYTDIVFEKGELTMKKGSLEGLVTAEDIEKIYDAVKTNITVVVDKKRLVDQSAKVTISYRTSDGEPWNPVNPSFVNNIEEDVFYRVEIPEYEPYESQAKLVIKLRPITLLSASATKTYDGEALVSNEVVIVSGTLAEGDSANAKEYLTYTCTGSRTEVGTAQNKYEYGVTNRLGTADLWKNYDFVIQEGTLTVEPAKLVYDPATYNGPYDNYDHFVEIPAAQKETLPDDAKVTYSTDGIHWKEDPEEFTGHDVTNVIVYVKVEAANYTTETVPVVLNIYKRELTLEGPNKNKKYDGAALTFTGSEIKDGGQRYADGECFAYSDFATITEVGETPSLFKYADQGTAKISNYDVTLITDRYLTVYPSDSEITVKSLSAKKEYDGTPLTAGFEKFGEDKLAEGDVIDAKIADTSSITTPGIVSNLFEYVKIMRDSEEVTGTYTNLVVITGVLEVVNANFDEVKALPIVKTYDGVATNVDVKVIDEVAKENGYKVCYSLDGVNFTDTNPEFLHACDETTVWYEVTADYFNAVTNSTTVRIDKRRLVYQSADDGRVENGEPLKTGAITLVEAESDGLVEGETVNLKPTGSVTLASEGPVEATFDVEFTEGEASDYTVVKRFGKLTIYPKNALTFIAGSKEFAYTGDAQSYPEYTVEGELKAGDAISVVRVEGSISHPSEISVANKVTDVVITNAAGVVVTDEYKILRVDGALTMKKGTLAVTSFGAEKTYDGVATNITVTVDTDSMVEASRETVVVKYSISPKGPFLEGVPTFTDAGTYDVYFTVEADGYEKTLIMSEQVKIGLRHVKLASAGDEKVYDGTKLATNEVKVVAGGDFLALASGDVLSYACTGSQTEVGESDNSFACAITNAATKLDVKNNYYVVYDYGKLVVTPARQEKDDPEDPPEGALTPYDFIGVYDGNGHSINPFEVTKPAEGAVLYFSSNATDWVESADGKVPALFFRTNVCDKVPVYFKSVAPNYADVVTNGFVTITQRVVKVSFTANDKAYDGTTVATLKATNVVTGVTGETFEFVQTGMSYAFDTAAVGNGKTVTATGYTDDLMNAGPNTDKANYSFDFCDWTLANITPGEITPKDPKEPENPGDIPPENPEDNPDGGDTPTIWAQNIVKEYDGIGTNIIAKVYNVLPADEAMFDYEYSTNDEDYVAWDKLQFTNVVTGLKVYYRAVAKEGANYLGTNCYAYVTITKSQATVEAIGAFRVYDSNATNIEVRVNGGEEVEDLKIWYAVHPSVPESDYDSPKKALMMSSLKVPADLKWRTSMPHFKDVATNDYAEAELQQYNFDGTNGAYVVWYKVTSRNFEDFVGYATVTIQPRTVEFSFPKVTKTFDGTPDDVGDGVETNLVRATHSEMVEGEEIVASGKGHFSSKSVGEANDYFVLTSLDVQPGNAATQLRNYRKRYTADGSTYFEVTVDANGETTLDGQPVDEDNPAARSEAEITPKEENPDDKKSDHYPDPDKPVPGGDPVLPPTPTKEAPLLSDYDTTNVYSGVGHTMDTNALWATIWNKENYIIDDADKPNVHVRYSIDGSDWYEWTETPPLFTNVTVTSFWYRVEVPNYATNVHAVAVTVVHRQITVKANDQAMVYDDYASLNPGFGVPAAWRDATDGEQDKGLADGESIGYVALRLKQEYTTYDPDKTYAGHVITNDAAMPVFIISNATADVTANYEISFEAGDLRVDENLALFKATLKWLYSKYSQMFHAHIEVTNTNKTDSFKFTPDSMMFCFEDRTNTQGQATLRLYGTDGKACAMTTNFTSHGVTTKYRCFKLEPPDRDDPTGGWGSLRQLPMIYGPKADATDAEMVLSMTNKFAAPLMNTINRVKPESGKEAYFNDPDGKPFLGWLVWDSNGTTCRIPLVDGLELMPGWNVEGEPVSSGEFNDLLAFGAPSDQVLGNISGIKVHDDRGEISLDFKNMETGVLVDPGPNAQVILQGAEDLGGPFEDMGELKTENGTAEFGLQGKQFFKIRAEALPVVK